LASETKFKFTYSIVLGILTGFVPAECCQNVVIKKYGVICYVSLSLLYHYGLI